MVKGLQFEHDFISAGSQVTEGYTLRSDFLRRVRWTQTQVLQGCSLVLPSRKDYIEFCISFKKVSPVFCVCEKKSISRINSRDLKVVHPNQQLSLK